MTETQPLDLTAFMMNAEYHVLHVGEVPADASESLISTGFYYAPRLFAAVRAALKHHQPDQQSTPICTCGLTYPCYEVRDITAALLGEGE